jgi:hypothetical protein
MSPSVPPGTEWRPVFVRLTPNESDALRREKRLTVIDVIRRTGEI